MEASLNRLWIVAHFDRLGLVADYVTAMLNAYRALGGKVLVVTTATLSGSARERLSAACDLLVERENVGLDFCSWRLGLSMCDQGRGYDEIIFANDSVYGPFTDIAPILQRFSGTSTPFLGLTLTKEYAPHVQSFFLGFNMRVFPRRLFEAFWNSVEPLNDKNEIIDRYEIGLSRTIAAAGIPLSAVFDMREQRIRIGILKLFSQLSPERWTDVLAVRRIWGAQFTRRSNPMMAHWREVLDAGVPYVKVELMRDNPVGVSRSAVLKAVAAYGGPHAANIRAHLSAIGAIGNHRQ